MLLQFCPRTQAVTEGRLRISRWVRECLVPCLRRPLEVDAGFGLESKANNRAGPDRQLILRKRGDQASRWVRTFLSRNENRDTFACLRCFGRFQPRDQPSPSPEAKGSRDQCQSWDPRAFSDEGNQQKVCMQRLFLIKSLLCAWPLQTDLYMIFFLLIFAYFHGDGLVD